MGDVKQLREGAKQSHFLTEAKVEYEKYQTTPRIFEHKIDCVIPVEIVKELQTSKKAKCVPFSKLIRFYEERVRLITEQVASEWVHPSDEYSLKMQLLGLEISGGAGLVNASNLMTLGASLAIPAVHGMKFPTETEHDEVSYGGGRKRRWTKLIDRNKAYQWAGTENHGMVYSPQRYQSGDTSTSFTLLDENSRFATPVMFPNATRPLVISDGLLYGHLVDHDSVFPDGMIPTKRNVTLAKEYGKFETHPAVSVPEKSFHRQWFSGNHASELKLEEYVAIMYTFMGRHRYTPSCTFDSIGLVLHVETFKSLPLFFTMVVRFKAIVPKRELSEQALIPYERLKKEISDSMPYNENRVL